MLWRTRVFLQARAVVGGDQPEGIWKAGARWELKAGIPVGLTASTPDVGVQVQVTWKFGERRL